MSTAGKKKVAIKAIRLKIINAHMDSDCTIPMENWRRELYKISAACGEAGNLCLTKLYVGSIHKREIYRTTGESVKGIPGCENLYQDIVQKFPDLPGSVSNQLERHAREQWSQNRQKVLQLQSSLPTYKITTAPIRFHHKIYQLRKSGGNYLIDVQLYSLESGQQTRRYLSVFVRDSSSRGICDQIINGTYAKGQLQIKRDHKGNWFGIVPYEFSPQEISLDHEKSMGVDLGVVKAVYWAFNDSHKRGCIQGGEVEQFRKTIQARRKSIQKQTGYSGRRGHGRTRVLRPTDILKKKEQNFRDTINHRYAHKIVGEAIKHGCGVIQIEDLQGIATDNRFLKSWPYFDLQQKIISKAKEYGITVIKINPQYTSQRCSSCGHIDRLNRPTQAVFSCQKCGYGNRSICIYCHHVQTEGNVCENCGGQVRKEIVNADYNAAKNISVPQIDHVIKLQCQDEGLDYRSYICKNCEHTQVTRRVCEECGSTKFTKA